MFGERIKFELKSFQIYAKILVVQLLFESYIIWIDAPKPLNEGEYASEKEFYFSFLLTAIGKCVKPT